MKSVYERTNLIITEFDTDDVIITSGLTPPIDDPVVPSTEPSDYANENSYGTYKTFSTKRAPGSWF